MPRPLIAYSVSFGLAGCYMPDSISGAMTFDKRSDLANCIRDELKTFDLPASLFREVNLRKLWRTISKHGASSYTFSLIHGGNALTFHGLTTAEYEADQANEY